MLTPPHMGGEGSGGACLVVLGVQVHEQESVARMCTLRSFLPAAGRPQRAGRAVALGKLPREGLRLLLGADVGRALRQALDGACEIPQG